MDRPTRKNGARAARRAGGRWTLTAGLLVLVGVTLGVGQPAAHAAAPGPDTLVVGIDRDALTMDPMDFRHRETETILRNVFDGFVTRNPQMESVNQLAETVEPIDDTTWEITIRKGVTWHDGSSFTAEDAAYSVNRTVQEGRMGGRTSPRKGLFEPVTGAEVVGDRTIRVHLDAPWPIFMRMLPHMLVAPASTGDEMIAEPVGTGPFRFVDWDRGSQVILERNDVYYGGSPDIPPVGPAKVDRVVFRVIPESSSRLAALLAGEIDVMTIVQPDDIPVIERNPNLEVVTVNGTRSYFLEMNVNEPPFDDVRVRRAMNLAIDVDTAIDAVLGGLATPIATILSPQSFGFDESLQPYGYDPEKARQLLREAGYPNGFELTLDTLPHRRAVAEAYAFMLGQVGIDANVRVWTDEGSYLEQIQAGNRMAWLYDWGSSILDPADIATPKLGTADRGNYTGYSNPEVDRLLAVMNTSIESDVRLEAAVEMQQIIFEDAPMVFEYVAQDVYAINKRVRGWEPIPDSRINLHDVSKATVQ